jgi:hypothetical protein
MPKEAQVMMYIMQTKSHHIISQYILRYTLRYILQHFIAFYSISLAHGSFRL